MLNDVSNMIAFRAGGKALTFLVEVDETIPDSLHGDEVRVRQILTNILTNAVKYTMEGTVTLLVNAERVSDDKIDLIATIKDTGIGIKEEDMEKLFTKFGRVDLKQTNTIEGTGLGLAITENLLLMMQGDIKVESVYGEGSVFTVRIPQGVLSNEAIGDFHHRFEEGLKTLAIYRETGRAPEARVLVVDDTELNLVVIEGLLKMTEVKLDTASGGDEALKLCADVSYDLILMDQRMPHMNGTETLAHIRAQEEGLNKETPVICLTADAVQGARERYLEEGFSDYLTKPVDGGSLEATLMKYLPAEKVVHVKDEEIAREKEGGSEIKRMYDSVELLDYEEARTYSSSDELLEKSLRMYFDLIPENIKTVESLLEQGDIENYTIKVHALKSASRLIGAGTISELALKLEESGDAVQKGEGTREFIDENTPVLVSMMGELREALTGFLEKDIEDKELSPVSADELDELYEAVSEFLSIYDQDGILRLLDELEEHTVPDSEKDKIEKIRKCATGSDWKGLEEALSG